MTIPLWYPSSSSSLLSLSQQRQHNLTIKQFGNKQSQESDNNDDDEEGYHRGIVTLIAVVKYYVTCNTSEGGSQITRSESNASGLLTISDEYIEEPKQMTAQQIVEAEITKMKVLVSVFVSRCTDLVDYMRDPSLDPKQILLRFFEIMDR